MAEHTPPEAPIVLDIAAQREAWLSELRANMPSEEEIERRAAADPDNPEWTDEELANARTVYPEATDSRWVAGSANTATTDPLDHGAQVEGD